MPTMTTRQRDIDERVRAETGLSLRQWALDERARDGDQVGWDVVAARLYALTGDTVSGETLIRWFGKRKSKRRK